MTRSSTEGNDRSRNRNKLRQVWDARSRTTLTATLFQIEAALSIHLADVRMPDAERSYRALDALRDVLTPRWRAGV